MKKNVVRQVRLHITWLVYAFLGAIVILSIVYYFFVKVNKDQIYQRSLRNIASVSDNLEIKINAITTPVIRVIQQRVKGQTRDKIVTNDKTAYLGSGDWECMMKSIQSDLGKMTNIAMEDDYLLELYEQKFNTYRLIQNSSRKKENSKELSYDETFEESLRLESYKSKLNIFWDYKYDFKGQRYVLRVRLPLNHSAFFEDLIHNDIFNSVLFVKMSLINELEIEGAVSLGEVIYQHKQMGHRISRLDQLRTSENEPWSIRESLERSIVANVYLGGKRHALFSQPTPIHEWNQFGKKNLRTNWVTLGLIDSEQVMKESMSLSVNVAILFLGFLTLVLFSIPLIRLKYISRDDELDLYEIVLLNISVLLVLFIASLLFLDVQVYQKIADEADVQIENLAKQMRSNFEMEIDVAFEQLSQLSDLKHNNEFMKYLLDSSEYMECDGQKKDLQVDVLDDIVLALRGMAAIVLALGVEDEFMNDAIQYLEKMPYPFFNLAIWIDEKGEQISKWKIKGTASPLINVKDRQYFKRVVSGDGWRYKDEHIYIEPLHSYTTGKIKTVLSRKKPGSKKSNIYEVEALETSLVAFSTSILPNGFGFAVIDPEGRTLYHSDSRRSLRENFVAECENDKSVLSVMQMRSKEYLDINYMGKPTRARVEPLMTGLPWTLITFYDKENVRVSNLMILSKTFVYFLMYFGVFASFSIFLYGVVKIICVFKPPYQWAWMWPDKDKPWELVSVLLSFSVVIVFYFFVILKSQSISVYLSGVMYFSFIALSCLLVRIIARSRLYTRFFPKFSFPILSLFLSALASLGFFFSVCSFCAFGYFSLGFLLVLFSSFTPDWNFRFPGTASWLYALTGLLFSIIIVLLPTWTFIEIAYLQQRDLIIQRMQFDMNQKLIERLSSIKDDMEFSFDKEYQEALLELRTDFYFRNSHGIPVMSQFDNYSSAFYGTSFSKFTGDHKFISKESVYGSEIMNQFLMFLFEYQYSKMAAGQDYIDNRSFNWDERESSLVLVNPVDKWKIYTSMSEVKSPLSSRFSFTEWNLPASLLLLFFVFCSFFVVRFLRSLISQIFLLDIRPMKSFRLNRIVNLLKNGGDSGFKYTIIQNQGLKVEDSLFSSFAEVVNFNDAINNEILEKDCDALLKKSLTDGRKPIVILNFDYAPPGREPHDLKLQKFKFRFLQNLKPDSSRSIVIFSGFDPEYYFSYFNDFLGRDIDFLHWAEIMKPFKAVGFVNCKSKKEIEPASSSESKKDEKTGSDLMKNDKSSYFYYLFGVIAKINDYEKLYSRESGDNSKLQKISKMLFDEYQKSFNASESIAEVVKPRTDKKLIYSLYRKLDKSNENKARERLVISVLHEFKDMARSEYRQIWVRCTGSERLLLHDLARDGFANHINHRALRLLMAKGLIVPDRCMRFFNESFRLFVLDEFSEKDYSREETPNTITWGMLKIPLMLTLGFGGLFLLLTQKELIHLIIALSTAIGVSLIPELLATSLTKKNASEG